MEHVILDTSVVIKWFLDEPDSRAALWFQAQHFNGQIIIAAPSLQLYEVINVLCTKSQVEFESISAAIKSWYQTKLEQHNLDSSWSTLIAQLSRDFQISAYDASYIALAQKLKCPLITADQKLFQKVKKLNFVKLLSTDLTIKQ